jgi:DNA invertase Pin-like site-specific DNA recombinase
VNWARRKAQWRPEFQRLLKEVEAGRVQWIIVDRQDRFEAADKFEFFHYLHTLRQHGCRLFTVDDKELTSNETVASLTTHLNSDQSERELREKSVRVLEGMMEKAEQGDLDGWPASSSAWTWWRFGVRTGKLIEQWRVEIIDDEHRVKVDPQGNRRDYLGKENFPATESDEVLQLRPSRDQRKIEVV